MSIWQFFKRWRAGSLRKKKEKRYSFTPGDLFDLELIKAAIREKLRQNEWHSDSRPEYQNVDEHYQFWIKLSPREQDVTALTCLKYTNAQIAARLGLSIETVRSYLDNAINKLGIQTKADLRVFFAGWDFGEWERLKDPHRWLDK